jgi:sulfur-oxidizing protein SoxB
MSITRREFLQVLAVAAAQGLPRRASAAAGADALYDLPQPAGNVTLLHLTDCHAQLRPLHFREPDANLGLFAELGRPPHLVGEALLKRYRIEPRSRLAHAYTHLDFEDAARRYGRVGGFAHLATLVKRLRAQRPGALLLDGGDSWQGSATALWTRGADMIACSKLLGVEVIGSSLMAPRG